MRIDQRERLLRKQLRKLLPVNKDDLTAIEAISAQGYPTVQPILLDLLKWIRDESWPVAKPTREFLVTIGPRLAPQVREVLGSRSDSLKAEVLRQIVSEWPSEAVRGLSDQLFLIATDGQSWGADLLALRLLAQHRIGDPKWITDWLQFKRQHHEKRLSEIAEIRRMLAVKQRVRVEGSIPWRLTKFPRFLSGMSRSCPPCCRLFATETPTDPILIPLGTHQKGGEVIQPAPSRVQRK